MPAQVDRTQHHLLLLILSRFADKEIRRLDLNRGLAIEILATLNPHLIEEKLCHEIAILVNVLVITPNYNHREVDADISLLNERSQEQFSGLNSHLVLTLGGDAAPVREQKLLLAPVGTVDVQVQAAEEIGVSALSKIEGSCVFRCNLDLVSKLQVCEIKADGEELVFKFRRGVKF